MNYRLHRNHQRASGRTYWQLVWDDNSGATLKKSLGACSKREAQRKMQDFIASHAATPALKSITKSPKLFTWLDRYLEIREPELRKSTLHIHRQCCDQLKTYFSHDPRIEQIQRPAATDWRIWLGNEGGFQGKPLGETTVCRQAKTAKVIMRYAMTEGLIASNPFDHLKVTPPRKDRSKNSFVRPEELASVLLMNREIEPLLMLCYHAGLRFSEALHLPYGDVFPFQRKLVVRPREGEETSKQRYREVKITRELFEWGDSWDTHRGTLMASLGITNLFSTTDAVCFQQEPLASQTVCGILETSRQNLCQRLLKKACEDAGVAPFTFTDLRRTRSTLWFSQYPRHIAEAWMGHSEEVARNHYLSIPDEYYSSDDPARSDHGRTMRHTNATPQTKKPTCDSTDGLFRRSGSGPYWTYPASLSVRGPIRITRCGGAK